MADIEIIWITVDSHINRSARIRRELKRCGIDNSSCVSAFTSSTLPPLFRKEPNYADDTVYARMCSHVKAMAVGLKSNKNFFLIIEDDMVFLEGLDGLSSLIEKAPPNAEVLQLFCCNPDVYGELMNSDRPFVAWSGEKWHVGAYLISREGAQKNVDMWCPDGISYDFRRTPDGVPTNPEAVVFAERHAYTATKTMFCVDETIPSEIYPDRFTDQIYANFMIRAIRNFRAEGKTYIFVVSAGSFVSRAKELVDILNREICIHINNESLPILPWSVDEDHFNAKIKQLERQKAIFVGDSANYFLPYLPMLIDKFGHRVKMVCLRDNRGECVRAFMEHTPSRNHWTDHDGVDYIADGTWDKCFPKYPLTLLKSDLIGQYWDEFYETAQKFQDRYPEQLRIFSSRELNIESIFRFLNITKRVPR